MNIKTQKKRTHISVFSLKIFFIIFTNLMANNIATKFLLLQILYAKTRI